MLSGINAGMTLNELVAQSHGLARDKGWWDDASPNIPEKLALIHSEVSEVLEAMRTIDPVISEVVDGKPEGYGVEIADVVIRIADLCGFLGLDLEALVREKHAYNQTRPRKHGKRF